MTNEIGEQAVILLREDKLIDEKNIKVIADDIQQIVLKTLKHENAFSYDVDLTNYGMSSLMYIIIISKINEAFKINIPFEDVPAKSTINSLAGLVLSCNKGTI